MWRKLLKRLIELYAYHQFNETFRADNHRSVSTDLGVLSDEIERFPDTEVSLLLVNGGSSNGPLRSDNVQFQQCL
jgi:hypothetical protein